MMSSRSITGYLTRQPKISALIYVAMLVACCFVVLSTVNDIVELYRARNVALETLARFEGRFSTERAGTKGHRPPGSPFLEGQTATVASAALLQRVSSTVIKAGGSIVSSEMVQQGAQSKDGYVTAIANCEFEPEALQKVLYDIEAGTPYLFIDQLNVQISTNPPQSGRLRVLLGVKGLWLGEKQ